MTPPTKKIKTHESWVDDLGQEYRPGDLVVYPAMTGSSGAYLCIGTVERINSVNSKGQEIREIVVIPEDGVLKRVSVPSATVSVRVVLTTKRSYRDNKIQTIQNVHNVIKLDPLVLSRWELDDD